MEKIYIGFSRHDGSILSKTIRLAEGSEYSHVYIRRVSKYGEYIYQASGLTVNFTNIDIFKKNNTIVEEYEFELPDEKKEKLLAFFIKYAGAGYEVASLLKILIMMIGNRFNLKIKFEASGDDEFICSELAAFFCEEILDIDIEGVLDFYTPKMLNPIIKRYGKRVV